MKKLFILLAVLIGLGSLIPIGSSAYVELANLAAREESRIVSSGFCHDNELAD